MSGNEKILKDIHDVYTGAGRNQDGLHHIATELGLNCIVPSRKVTVMIVGNHSAGKSSFINWYVQEKMQKTGVAIETSGITICTSGKKRETLKGESTLKIFPQYDELEEFEGVVANLNTEICTSKEKMFPLLNLIDTPGLTDGNMSYPFEVEEVIPWFANHADLIFVFFDPIGQALCYRTMNVVEALNENHLDKLKYYMTKADEVPNEQDRSKVLIQITQNLSARIKNAHAFDLPTIYIPLEGREEQQEKLGISNSLPEVCTDIEKTITMKVQANLSQLEHECNTIIKRVDALVEEDEKKKNLKFGAVVRSYGYVLAALVMPALVLFMFTKSHVIEALEIDPTSDSKINLVFRFFNTFDGLIEGGYSSYLVGVAFMSFLIMYIMSKMVIRNCPKPMAAAEFKKLKAWQAYVASEVIPLKKSLYTEYFKQSVNLDDP